MALTTQSIKKVGKDMTPEYYTAFDAEGKGYLAKRTPVKKVKEEEEGNLAKGTPVKKKRGKK